MNSSSSLGSNSSALYQDAKRVNRFLSRKSTPPPEFKVDTVGESLHSNSFDNASGITFVMDGVRVNRFLSRKDRTSQGFGIGSPLLGLNSLSACASSESLQYVSFEKAGASSDSLQCVSFEKAECKPFTIEGRHGPVTSNKPPNDVRNKRDSSTIRKKKYKQYIAAKQNERMEYFRSHETTNSVLSQHTLAQTEYGLCSRQNESPTTVAADISAIRNAYKSDILNDKFICKVRSSPRRGSFNRNIGMIPKKKLTWWDDEINRHKPFLLRSDDLDYDDDSCVTSSRPGQPFGHSGCPHDNLKDLIEDYSNRLKSTVVDMFQTERIRNADLFRYNFASFSEDLVDGEKNNDEEEGGCAGPSRQLMKVFQNMLPPVCEFETYAVG